MTTFLLVRHALHELGSETIAGRTPDVHLSPDGLIQARSLAERLGRIPFQALYTSPLTRTRQTAEAIAAATGLTPIVADEIVELDFGEWMGARLGDLRPLDHWKRFNSFRSGTRAPGGELMLEVQLRIVRFMLDLRKRHSNETVALVSHADVIKCAVSYFLGAPLDQFLRIEISPASVTVLAVADHGPWLLGLNHTGELPQLPY
jgi:probable phosphoglycerate mutase